MGRHPKPMAVIKANGTFEPSRHRKREHEPSCPGDPERPTWIKGEARKMWDSAVPMLREMGVLQRIDWAELAAMCRWWATWRRTDKELEKCTGDDYRLTLRAGMAWKHFDNIAKRFGLTPVDRVGLATSVDESEGDPLLEMLKARSKN